ncbi:486_t:CDS:1 [Dentiscutata erythropus]|uniref:486_t:CDS:1 n=1 Tax=Dentiscutata erythropus TaxID=1348616 RepID=A0A9N9E5H3_9GLOM|nr:486_t:CDS:1 [Dentiscutata erythropus]
MLSFFKEPVSIIYHHIIWLNLCIHRPLMITVEGPRGDSTYMILPPTPHHHAKTYAGMLVAYFMDNCMEYVGSLLGQYMYYGPPVVIQLDDGLIQKDNPDKQDKPPYEQEQNKINKDKNRSKVDIRDESDVRNKFDDMRNYGTVKGQDLEQIEQSFESKDLSTQIFEQGSIKEEEIYQEDQGERSLDDSGIDIGDYLPKSVDENEKNRDSDFDELITTTEILDPEAIQFIENDNYFLLETVDKDSDIGEIGEENIRYFDDDDDDEDLHHLSNELESPKSGTDDDPIAFESRVSNDRIIPVEGKICEFSISIVGFVQHFEFDVQVIFNSHTLRRKNTHGSNRFNN